MDDGKQVIAKVPNPNAGRAQITTASEVATMDFVRNILGLPVPMVHSWSSTAINSVGAEYIIMEKANGIELSRKWPEMSGADKYLLTQAVVGFEQVLTSASFGMIGSLYYAEDAIGSTREGVLYVSEGEGDVRNSEFAVGPITSRQFFDDGRGAMEVDRGPWRTNEEYIIAMGRREVDCIHGLEKYPRPEGLFYGPGCYKPSPLSKLSALHDYLKVAKYILPSDSTVLSSTLWYGDLHSENIFVNPENPTEIVGIIDWQSVHIGPLFLQACHPAFLDFEGPKIPGFQHPSLPENFNELSAVQQKAAKKLNSDQSLYKLYEIESAMKNKKVHQALLHQETLRYQIIIFAGNLLNDGEPIVKGQLMQLEREWSKLVGEDSPPCPLNFSLDEKAAQQEDQRKWARGIALMADVLESLGGAQGGWNGWVKHEDYNVMRKKLQLVYEQFLDYTANDDDERALWSEAWPFGDSLPKALYNFKGTSE